MCQAQRLAQGRWPLNVPSHSPLPIPSLVYLPALTQQVKPLVLHLPGLCPSGLPPSRSSPNATAYLKPFLTCLGANVPLLRSRSGLPVVYQGCPTCSLGFCIVCKSLIASCWTLLSGGADFSSVCISLQVSDGAGRNFITFWNPESWRPQGLSGTGVPWFCAWSFALSWPPGP